MVSTSASAAVLWLSCGSCLLFVVRVAAVHVAAAAVAVVVGVAADAVAVGVATAVFAMKNCLL